VLALWSDDGVLMPPHHSSVHGRAEIERYLTRLFQQRRFKFSFTSSYIQIAGSFAFERVKYVASTWPAQGGPKVRDVGKGLHVYRKQPGGLWTLMADILKERMAR
jgi:ketosteroid isomerase-like protein